MFQTSRVLSVKGIQRLPKEVVRENNVFEVLIKG